MAVYFVAKVKEDSGFDFLLGTLTTVKARNYDQAIDKAIKKLCLRKGDTLSILRLNGNRPKINGFAFSGRYQVTV